MALAGYRLEVVVPDKMSREKVDDLRALGAEVVVTRSDVPKGPPEHYQDLAERLARERGAFYVSQFTNPANVAAHYETTGPEIWEQLEGRVDAAVFAAGTGGTLTGAGRYLKERRPELAERLRFVQGSVGSILGPLDSYLVLRGIKTLALRMERHSSNAARIATWLEAHPAVRKVSYPGLRSHPQHELARRQMRLGGEGAYGGMVTVWLEGGLEAARRFLERLRVFTLAESLGGVESLVEHPAVMTHASVPPERHRELGIDDGLCRLSVGIEHVDDLLADLEQALGASASRPSARVSGPRGG